MRTFKQKPRATQQATSAKSTILRRPHFIGSRNELKAAESYPPVQFFETPESRPSPFTEGLPEAEHTFEGDRYVRPLNDDNFDNIFYNRDKVIVVQFWNAYCRGPCGRIAHRISAVAEQYRTGPYTDLVRFYHVQLDESADTGEIPNPRLSTRFGFESVPVTYFYGSSAEFVGNRKRLL